MAILKLFLQFEGHRPVELIQIDENAVVRELLAAASKLGLPDDIKNGGAVFEHEGETPLEMDLTLKASGIRDKHRIHIHRCKRIEVTLHFNEVTERLYFPPATTVDKVKKEFVKKIGMSPIDATEHVLQICGGTDRPEPDTHIGALVCGRCAVCFDLVPIKRVEG
jgi:hypothetical protein